MPVTGRPETCAISSSVTGIEPLEQWNNLPEDFEQIEEPVVDQIPGASENNPAILPAEKFDRLLDIVLTGLSWWVRTV
jgi:hypothetical protein